MADRHQHDMPPFIQAIHEQVSTFARARFQAEGRGLIEATTPIGSALKLREPARPHFVYHTVSEFRRRTADLTGGSRDTVDMLLRMIDTYDPTMQAVLIATLDGQNPVSLRVKLAPVRRAEASASTKNDFVPPCKTC
jgi:hypothetical protein